MVKTPNHCQLQSLRIALTQPAADPDEGEEDEFLWVVREVHLEPSPNKEEMVCYI